MSVIHVVGASGAGTTTLGQTLERLYGYTWLDTDGFFWQPTDPPFTTPVPREERLPPLTAALERHPRCVISGSLCGWGDALIPRFELVVFLDTPTDVRVARLKAREDARFGDRVRPGGDMYENNRTFIEWAATYDVLQPPERSRALHEQWLRALPCPVLRLDGTRPAADLAAQVAARADC